MGLNLPVAVAAAEPGPAAGAAWRDYEAGKLFVRYSYDLVTDMAPFQNTVTRGENP